MSYSPGGQLMDLVITPMSMWSVGAECATEIAATPVSAAWTTNNRALYTPFYVPTTCKVLKLGILNGATASGNSDVGIYTAGTGGPGTLVIARGGGAETGTDVIQEFDVTDTWLQPGQYYVAVALSSTVGTVYRTQFGTAARARGIGMCMQETAYVLPSTATPVVTTVADIPMWQVSLRTLLG